MTRPDTRFDLAEIHKTVTNSIEAMLLMPQSALGPEMTAVFAGNVALSVAYVPEIDLFHFEVFGYENSAPKLLCSVKDSTLAAWAATAAIAASLQNAPEAPRPAQAVPRTVQKVVSSPPASPANAADAPKAKRKYRRRASRAPMTTRCCDWCDKPYTIQTRFIENGQRLTCSTRCSYKARVETRRKNAEAKIEARIKSAMANSAPTEKP